MQNGTQFADDCDTSTGVLLAFLLTVILLSLCASCSVYLCVSVLCLPGTKDKEQGQQSDLSYFRSPVSAGEAARLPVPPDVRSAVHGHHQRCVSGVCVLAQNICR